MIWLITYIIGVCVVYSVLNRWNTIQDEDDFFAASFFEGMIDGVIMAGRVVFWPIWLAWLVLSAILEWFTWLTGFDATNRQRVWEGLVELALVGLLIVVTSPLWEKLKWDTNQTR
jgi:hypothetical protein